MKRRVSQFWARFFALAVALFLVGGNTTTNAFTEGKTYDKGNYQEVEKLLIPCVKKWVADGDFVLKTGILDYDLALDKAYAAASQKNAGIYDVNKEGVVVDKQTGNVAGFVYGNPFPVIDPGEENAGAKIVSNFKYTIHFRREGVQGTGAVRWIGKKGLERQILSQEYYFAYQNREEGELPNPNGYLYLMMNSVPEPFDLKGTVLMTWTYKDDRTDTSFAYVPMLRRVRRIPAATRSDPWIGSDFCVDDTMSWSGKNASVDWKLIGEQTALCAFGSTKIKTLERLPDGAIQMAHDYVKKGFEVPGWKGASWAPVTATWIQRDVWVVEGVHKDPYYNYGKMILYLDKENYVIYFKVLYDRAGQYWKTQVNTSSVYETNDGVRYIGLLHFMVMIDDRGHHASVTDVGVDKYAFMDKMRIPLSEYNEQFFSEANMRQLSK